jgi:multiple sugar transport system permease protein
LVLAATVAAALLLGPVLWTILTSLKTLREALHLPPTVLFAPTLENYRIVFSHADFDRALSNTVIVTATSVIVSMILGSVAAYALTRLRIPGGDAVAVFLLVTRFVPPISTVVPMFLIARSAGLYDTRLGLILAHTAMNLPYVVWIMRGFFKELPEEVEEAAFVDGCSRVSAFLRVVVPMARPGLAATAILAGIFSWNDFMYALVLTGFSAKTLPLGISAYIGELGIQWTEMAAAGTVVMLPALVFSAFVQRQIARGLTLGAVKQ